MDVIHGVYPTMITPYRNGKIDFSAVEKLVEWYWEMGCDGIFAACQSSEIQYLSPEERQQLVRTVVEKSRLLSQKDAKRPPMMIVASGHVSDDFEEQVRELNMIAEAQPDALILISNRMDIDNTGDEAWIAETERLVEQLPPQMPLGIYECPKPYKRLMSEKMLRWCAESGRFYFLKDTCCDAEEIARRLKWCQGSNLHLFNANAQTLLSSLRNGAAGYCGVMANFHPALYVELMRADWNSPKASLLQDFLGLAAMAESFTYPCCAKYHLDRREGIPMDWTARSADVKLFTPYQQSCVDQLAELADRVLHTARSEGSRKSKLRFLVMDVDGTLTDGKLYFGKEGEVMKAFHIKDGCGIRECLIPAGIVPVILTARKSSILEVRCRELSINALYQDVTDKLGKLKQILKEAHADFSNVAYIGDDRNDLTCMRAVHEGGGTVGCPADAIEAVRHMADFVSTKNGGDGAVREFIEWLLVH